MRSHFRKEVSNPMQNRARYKSRKKRPVLRLLLIAAALVTALALVSQPAFAQNTYVINDGSHTFTYTTFATDPEEVLDQAGLQLSKDDTYTLDGSTVITVQRSQEIDLMYYGEHTRVTSYGETVEVLLERLNITLDENDVVSLPMQSATYDGMTLRVDRVLKLEQTYSGAIAHETTYCYDSSLPAGSETVITPGTDGEMLCTATVTYVNGQETGRTVHSQTVTAAPITEVVAIGTGEVPAIDPNARPVIGDGTITLPTGEVLTYTGTWEVLATAYTHTDEGCDYVTATGTIVHIGTVAVDPRYIPYGTRMFIVTNDGSYVYGIATAEDCGGGIKGERIDLYFPSYRECMQFGRRQSTIYFLGSEE